MGNRYIISKFIIEHNSLHFTLKFVHILLLKYCKLLSYTLK